MSAGAPIVVPVFHKCHQNLGEMEAWYDEWLKALEPIGTTADKPHLTVAPWLIVVFAQRWGVSVSKKAKADTIIASLEAAMLDRVQQHSSRQAPAEKVIVRHHLGPDIVVTKRGQHLGGVCAADPLAWL